MSTFRINKKTQRTKKKTVNCAKRDLQLKDDDQAYAKVLKTLGNCRLELECYDGIKRLGHIRGSMKNKIWIEVGDIVLVGFRDFQDDKCDIILKYTPDEVRKMINFGELPNDVENKEENVEEETDSNIGFTFDDI